MFWSAHDPVRASWSRQYRSAIFVATDEERALAEQTKAAREAALGRPLHTAIEDASTFWQAETYHQKYRLQGHPDLMKELMGMYPSDDAFVGSTAAARLNAWLAGHHGDDALRELDRIGLSEAARRPLAERIGR